MFKNAVLYVGKAVIIGLVVAAIFLMANSYLTNGTLHSQIFKPKDTGRSELSFAKAVRRAAPAVVNIYSLSIDQRRPLNPGALQGLGSGVIMSAQGYILTNYHVIKSADEIVIALQDGRKFTSEVVGSDPDTDLSVLKIEGDNLPVAPLNLNSLPEVGDVVLAIGNPYNLGQTITQGIISATGRNGLSSGYLDFLQTDAAINEGNSGGALINTQGDLIGINTAAFKVGGDSGNHGINFSIPTKLAYSIMQKLIKDGRVIRGMLGVSGDAVTPVMAQIFKLPEVKGVLISGVDPTGPAAKAQIQPRDLIIQFEGEEVPGFEMLMDRVAETKPGSTVTLTIIRQGQPYEVAVTIAEKPINYSQ
ncbi:outer membrane-stress sensor serine endopeptidase DegS [Shewanella gelidii]|uniref:Outer membrane-stress sensor serine endopeptidase DegS n=1 Tax=Shewanella gelidii TaxID=1642821 RepID=A0A917N952_9GAMM|nr:outer membrane-stress sensor serine endopeptidase DegS [Shewanella gelidii]MCL1097694.1 outer membrane-stress sensor serine endopeptidase DegS [Shewanella gelidii]GGI79474.1 outer membrane-stress sensor serine endopeptidase DegS [Shewanella gelidii]